MFLFFWYRTEIYWHVHVSQFVVFRLPPPFPALLDSLSQCKSWYWHIRSALSTFPLGDWSWQIVDAVITSLILLVLSVGCLLVEETPFVKIACLAIVVTCTIAIVVMFINLYVLLVYVSKTAANGLRLSRMPSQGCCGMLCAITAHVLPGCWADCLH